MQTRARRMPTVLAAILSSEMVTMTVAKMDGAKIRSLGVHLYHAFVSAPHRSMCITDVRWKSNDEHYTELMGLYHSTEIALSLHRRLAGFGIEDAYRRLAVCYATEAGLCVISSSVFSRYADASFLELSTMYNTFCRPMFAKAGSIGICVQAG